MRTRSVFVFAALAALLALPQPAVSQELTWPQFRGLGLYTYLCGVRLKYMREHGFTRCRDAVRSDNVASLKGQAWWNPRPCLSGRFIRVLRWTSWREYPYEGAST